MRPVDHPRRFLPPPEGRGKGRLCCRPVPTDVERWKPRVFVCVWSSHLLAAWALTGTHPIFCARRPGCAQNPICKHAPFSKYAVTTASWNYRIHSTTTFLEVEALTAADSARIVARVQRSGLISPGLRNKRSCFICRPFSRVDNPGEPEAERFLDHFYYLRIYYRHRTHGTLHGA